MSHWASTPGPRHLQPKWQILRTPPAGTICGVILSDQHEGAFTHYYRGRSTPCTAPNCPACDERGQPRWYGYFAAECGTNRMRVLVEITPSAYPALEDALARYKTLRGLQFKLQRVGRKANGRLHLALTNSSISPANLPEKPNIRAILTHIWETSPTSEKEPRQTPEQSNLHNTKPVNNRTVRHHEQPQQHNGEVHAEAP